MRPTTAQLPGGGRSILPAHRVVALYGHPGVDELGILGIGSPQRAARRLDDIAGDYGGPGLRPIMPAFELITPLVLGSPGEDGMYRKRLDDAAIARYHRAAREADALLILDIQPGRADFIDEARALERWLKEPDVSLALDPEWHMGPGEVPGKTIGSVDAATINEVSQYFFEEDTDLMSPNDVLGLRPRVDVVIYE